MGIEREPHEIPQSIAIEPTHSRSKADTSPLSPEYTQDNPIDPTPHPKNTSAETTEKKDLTSHEEATLLLASITAAKYLLFEAMETIFILRNDTPVFSAAFTRLSRHTLGTPTDQHIDELVARSMALGDCGASIHAILIDQKDVLTDVLHKSDEAIDDQTLTEFLRINRDTLGVNAPLIHDKLSQHNLPHIDALVKGIKKLTQQMEAAVPDKSHPTPSALLAPKKNALKRILDIIKKIF